MAASASFSVWQIKTPLPAARPLALITTGTPNRARTASLACADLVCTSARAVGMPAAIIMAFVSAFEVSTVAAPMVGPNTGTPTCWR